MTATQVLAPAMLQEVEPPPLLKFSFVCFCIFNLAAYSRFFEWHLTWMHVPLVTSTLALAGAAMEGRLLAVFSTRIGMCMAILTMLYAINVPFSSWRAGSLAVFTGDWLKTFLVFAITGALIFNVRQCRTALHSIGFGSGVAGLLVNLQGHVVGGRLALGKGTLANPNEVAFDLLLGLPFLWSVLKDSKGGKLKKLVAALLMLNSTGAILRTGSRGGLIGFAVLCLLFFLRASLPGKIVMSFAGIMLVLGGLVFLPTSVKIRYATTFSGSDRDAAIQEAISGGDESAVLSAAARRRLLINSLQLSLQHPILGVGIGQFGTYMAKIENSEGLRAGWQGTHNTYTQISSEAGTPALIAFVCMIVFSISGVRALSKRGRKLWQPGGRLPEIVDVAFALNVALVVYAVCVCFDYIAYSGTLPVLAALAIALMRCGNLELDRAERPQIQEKPNQVIHLYPIRAPRAMRPAAF